MFKCKSCEKEFPVVAWIENATTTYPSSNFSFPSIGPNTVTTFTNLQSTITIKKPCCPYCNSLDLEEVLAGKVAIRTIESFLEDVIQGKEKMKCSGFPIPGTHEVAEYELTIGKGTFGYACPKCGFGQGGSLSEEVCEKLRTLQKEFADKKS